MAHNLGEYCRLLRLGCLKVFLYELANLGSLLVVEPVKPENHCIAGSRL